jgi:hypothetical protein
MLGFDLRDARHRVVGVLHSARAQHRRLAVLAGVGGIAGVVAATMFVGTSRAQGPQTPPSPHTVPLSAGSCLWLQHHKNQVPVVCPAPPRDDGLLPDQGNAPSSASPAPGNGTAAAPAQLITATAPTHMSPPIRFGANVDATNPAEDPIAGQSETAVATSGNLIVSAWNDLSGALFSPGSVQGSVTGVGFSADGGATFQDLGGLPNNDHCQQFFGDPGVVSYRASDGTTYFYVTTLYLPSGDAGCGAAGYFGISMSTGKVAAGSSTISFGNPVVVPSGGNWVDQFTSGGILSFLDKSFPSIDRAHGRIAVSFTCFGVAPYRTPFCNPWGDIHIALCDISAPSTPTCSPGKSTTPYLVGARNPSTTNTSTEYEGAYPAFSARGDLYVAFSQNWITNLILFNPGVDPYVHQAAVRVTAGCLTLPATSCGTPVAVTIGTPIKSLDDTSIRGYTRVIGNDFPRVAYDDVTDQLVVVWNEANAHPMGDIVMARASADLGTVGPKVKVNDDSGFALHFLPAVSVDSSGNVNVSWYDRRNSGGTTRTDVYAASIRPGDDGGINSLVTSSATDWLSTGTLITPNFGDYTDNTSDGTQFTVNWTDGRTGIVNSFVATAQTK